MPPFEAIEGKSGCVPLFQVQSQPDLGRRIMADEVLDPKRLCRTFSYCTALMRSKHNDLGQFATGCPPFDKEVYGPIWDEARR